MVLAWCFLQSRHTTRCRSVLSPYTLYESLTVTFIPTFLTLMMSLHARPFIFAYVGRKPSQPHSRNVIERLTFIVRILRLLRCTNASKYKHQKKHSIPIQGTSRLLWFVTGVHWRKMSNTTWPVAESKSFRSLTSCSIECDGFINGMSIDCEEVYLVRTLDSSVPTHEEKQRCRVWCDWLPCLGLLYGLFNGLCV